MHRDFSKNLIKCIVGFDDVPRFLSEFFYEKWKSLKKISSIFIVQDVAWNIQKCILKVFSWKISTYF